MLIIIITFKLCIGREYIKKNMKEIIFHDAAFKIIEKEDEKIKNEKAIEKNKIEVEENRLDVNSNIATPNIKNIPFDVGVGNNKNPVSHYPNIEHNERDINDNQPNNFFSNERILSDVNTPVKILKKESNVLIMYLKSMRNQLLRENLMIRLILIKK